MPDILINVRLYNNTNLVLENTYSLVMHGNFQYEYMRLPNHTVTRPCYMWPPVTMVASDMATAVTGLGAFLPQQNHLSDV